MKRQMWLGLAVATSLAFSTALRAEDQPGAPKHPKTGKPEMTEEQRAQLEQRLDEAWGKMLVREKSLVMKLHSALRDMPAEERKFIHDRIERFLNMPAEERHRLHENSERWKTMTPEQREQARKQFEERRHAFEEKWRQEHPGEEPPPYPYGKRKPATPPATADNPKP